MHVCAHLCVSSPETLSLSLETGSLSCLLIILVWMAIKTQEYVYFYFPRTKTISGCLYAWLFLQVLGIELRSLGLKGKHLTN